MTARGGGAPRFAVRASPCDQLAEQTLLNAGVLIVDAVAGAALAGASSTCC